MATGRRAVVTGGGSGIGRGVAAALTAAGHTVTILGRNGTALQETVGAGDAADFRVADVTDDKAFGAAMAGLGTVDILVNNAGNAESAPFTRTDLAMVRRMMAVNFESVVTAALAVLPGMIARGFGRIVTVASIAGLKGYAYTTAYTASKHAVVGLTRALAREVARSGVTVNAVCPGYVDTPLTRRGAERVAARTGRPPEEIVREFYRENPQGRLITVAEVANAVLWLAGDGAAAVNGQAIAVTGGET
jgi:NAD(P)-dependent dehydrogenase (short-subunit alcohol dehydrogenase family)